MPENKKPLLEGVIGDFLGEAFVLSCWLIVIAVSAAAYPVIVIKERLTKVPSDKKAK